MPTAEEAPPLTYKSPTSPLTGHRWIALQAAVTAATLDLATQVWGWGGDGHRLVAELAESQLSAPAKLELDRLPLEPGATVASISTWVDETLTPRARGRPAQRSQRDAASSSP